MNNSTSCPPGYELQLNLSLVQASLVDVVVDLGRRGMAVKKIAGMCRNRDVFWPLQRLLPSLLSTRLTMSSFPSQNPTPYPSHREFIIGGMG